jgi:dTDP-4-dehydrorhamnose reductase
MRIAILGAAGQLGQEFARILPGEFVALARAAADLSNPPALRAKLQEIGPSVVINCASYNAVDRAESEPDAAFAVNALGVRSLALLCRELDCTLVHFSTNYVFGLDQDRAVPYVESDVPGPISVYAASKAAGEWFVRSLCPKHFVLRTCGLYGGSGTRRGNFVETMLRKAAEGEPVRVVADQLCTPTSAADLARASLPLLGSSDYGLYHVTNAGACSWFEFALAIFAMSGSRTPLTPIRSEEFVLPAKRPGYSVLSNARWIRAGFAPLRPWQDALAEYLAMKR